jgi:hypothetical protein
MFNGDPHADFKDIYHSYFGLWSIHFFRGKAYYNVEKDRELRFANDKKVPHKILFERVEFDSKARTFKGTIDWTKNPLDELKQI